MKSLLSFVLFLSCVGVYAQNEGRSIDSILNRIKNEKDPHERLKEQAKLVINYFTSGETSKADSLFTITEKEATRINSEPGKAAVYHTRGTMYYYTSGFDS